jgi:hypothetical protein
MSWVVAAKSGWRTTDRGTGFPAMAMRRPDRQEERILAHGASRGGRFGVRDPERLEAIIEIKILFVKKKNFFLFFRRPTLAQARRKFQEE